MSSEKIKSMIDDLLQYVDKCPSKRGISTEQRKQQKPSKKQNNAKDSNKKPKQKRKKRAAQIKQSNLPPPTLQNGIKSTLLKEMHSTYDPSQVESLWDNMWETKGYYKAKTNSEKKDKNQENFVMVIPPPNVTGSLHLGHALMVTIEDCITRYWRMKGKNVLWLPGTDHAGIATQTVVERRLMKEGKTRHDLGREKFLEQVWEWKNFKGGKICNQIRRMGCSVDWSREVFTMDDKLNIAVNEAFVRMYDDGLIYRDNRLCDWSCSLCSAISKVEVDKVEIKKPTFMQVPGYKKSVKFGIIHKFGYKVIPNDNDEKEEIVTVATTRLETMLGDTAIAVHPNDPRYTHLHGRFCQHPFIKDRTLPIICDDILVDMTFGTGCVKITPAHDFNDFECGKRHKLEFINILTDDGCINENGGSLFEGMKRYDARKAVEKELDTMGLFFGEFPNEMVLDVCSRSKDILEPLSKPQWYVNCDNLAEQAMDVVFKTEELKILPKKEGEHQWKEFLGNIRPWCISRQLWWGHRIPAYYFEFENEDDAQLKKCNWDLEDSKINWIIARNEKEAQVKAEKRLSEMGIDSKTLKYKLKQDEDVLDTWFSSGLFPFSTMGWPNVNDKDLKSFFPGDLLETGGDIIFFWVARMVMMSLHLMKTLPFHTVYLHPMVRDEYGKKMSKTSGNVIDPLHIIDGVTLDTLLSELHEGNIRTEKIPQFEKKKKKKFPNGIAPCGADALRFGLLRLLMQRSINLNVNGVINYRLFCNKVWNCCKFAISHFDDDTSRITKPETFDVNDPNLSIPDRWILSRLRQCTEDCEKYNPIYEFGASTNSVYQFFYHDFCDVYLEVIKPTLYEETADAKQKKITKQILYIVLYESLKLMHPFMPFLTEELFQRITDAKCGSIMVAKYPTPLELWNDDKCELKMKCAQEIAKSIRGTKQEVLGLSTKTKYNVVIEGNDDLDKEMLDMICTLSMSKAVDLKDNEQKNDCGNLFCIEIDGNNDKKMKLYHDVASLVNANQRIAKFNKEIGKLGKFIAKAEKAISNDKIKENIRKKEMEKRDDYQKTLLQYEQNIKQLNSMI